MAEAVFKARCLSGKLRCSQKGDFCWAEDNGYSWGAKISLPRFVLVICSTLTKAQLIQYSKRWMDAFDYTVLSANPATATYEVRVFNTTDNVSNDNPITLAKVNVYLTSWDVPE